MWGKIFYLKFIEKTNNGQKFGECFRYLCNRSGTKYKVKIHRINKNSKKKNFFICSRKGQKSRGLDYKFSFYCQDPFDVCQNMTSCDNDCYYR